MILGINTATDALSIALIEDGRVLAEGLRDVGTEHSEAAFELLEAVFAWARRPRCDLRGVGVAVGPGGFTGVRTGLSLAKTVAQVLGLPVYGVDTLTALALQFAGNAIIAPMLDARRGMVFAAVYVRDGDSVRALRPGALYALEDWQLELATFDGPLVIVGEGAGRHRAALSAGLPDAWLPPDAMMAARAAPVALHAERLLRLGEFSEGSALAPQYLREPQAVVNWEAAQEKAP
jgi:tRNA threonylcarbamoyladenosine biosynthesis protein TsaB